MKKHVPRSEVQAPGSLAEHTVPRRAQQINSSSWRQQGKIGWILLWLVGIPIPVLLGLFLLRGCT